MSRWWALRWIAYDTRRADLMSVRAESGPSGAMASTFDLILGFFRQRLWSQGVQELSTSLTSGSHRVCVARGASAMIQPFP